MNGFTLAEVLITLGIIGVVAAMTIPTLISSYQKQQTVAQLKKVNSLLSQSLQHAIADNGSSDTLEVEGNGNENAVNFTNKYVLPYLKVVKNCGTNITNECDFIKTALNGREDIYRTRLTTYGFTKIYLADGTEIAISVPVPNSSYRQVIVDINGDKGPNRVGKDVFELEYNLDNLTFGPRFKGYNSLEEYTASDNINACNKEQAGYSCASLIQFEGWQITKNYPW